MSTDSYKKSMDSQLMTLGRFTHVIFRKISHVALLEESSTLRLRELSHA